MPRSIAWRRITPEGFLLMMSPRASSVLASTKSYGGPIAISYAASHPERLARLGFTYDSIGRRLVCASS